MPLRRSWPIASAPSVVMSRQSPLTWNRAPVSTRRHLHQPLLPDTSRSFSNWLDVDQYEAWIADTLRPPTAAMWGMRDLASLVPGTVGLAA